jgi:hypothetical protein
MMNKPVNAFHGKHKHEQCPKHCSEMSDLRQKLLSAEANRRNGAKTYTVEQVSERLRGLIDGSV